MWTSGPYDRPSSAPPKGKDLEKVCGGKAFFYRPLVLFRVGVEAQLGRRLLGMRRKASGSPGLLPRGQKQLFQALLPQDLDSNRPSSSSFRFTRHTLPAFPLNSSWPRQAPCKRRALQAKAASGGRYYFGAGDARPA